MKKTLNVDDQLFQEAKKACAAATDTETVRLGLEALVSACIKRSQFRIAMWSSLFVAETCMAAVSGGLIFTC